jgi:hypothetical protein
MKSSLDSVVWKVLLPGFIQSTRAEMESGAYDYVFYLGFDVGDPIYDNEGQRALFEKTWESKMSFSKRKVVLKMVAVEGTKGAPSWAVCALAQQAYEDGADYIYQINDDSNLVTTGWTRKLIARIRDNPFLPNFGVTGPHDTFNGKILTHSFAQ